MRKGPRPRKRYVAADGTERTYHYGELAAGHLAATLKAGAILHREPGHWSVIGGVRRFNHRTVDRVVADGLAIKIADRILIPIGDLAVIGHPEITERAYETAPRDLKELAVRFAIAAVHNGAPRGMGAFEHPERTRMAAQIERDLLALLQPIVEAIETARPAIDVLGERSHSASVIGEDFPAVEIEAIDGVLQLAATLVLTLRLAPLRAPPPARDPDPEHPGDALTA